jgi:hypothetical protein
MAALCKPRESSRRGKPFNWNRVKETADDAVSQSDVENTKTVQPSSSSPPVSSRLSADQCPFCFFGDDLSPKDRVRPYSRIDSLRRHVLRVHLNQASRHSYSLQGLSLAPIRQSRIDRSPVQSAGTISRMPGSSTPMKRGGGTDTQCRSRTCRLYFGICRGGWWVLRMRRV